MFSLTLLHSEWPKLYRVLAVLGAVGLNHSVTSYWSPSIANVFMIEHRNILERKKKPNKDLQHCIVLRVSEK